MKISTQVGLVGFMMALSALTAQTATAAGDLSELHADRHGQSVESRLTRLSAALRQREGQLPASTAAEIEHLQAGWINGGGFANRRVWPNGWRDSGGFINNRDGGGFVNRRGGGGFVNVR
ncbi:hypothetical protein KR51_00029790 [Rubidibacter lacunae KORDI 51-2]|uniref:RSAM-associated Gly-rich repeat protein n=1 Tax=Rubidibacter lacunae KORDI 51-2 TaxID=582515 RepID=U5D711_9CHRO|nr:GrrA/OscA1 family cyclophane-containing rSAM-modified RiPP [Rubidibacter lacunae]ERN40438.1 hypothetical protein KR51_00029790 [Rubidibacter lacunae KORDI 51-2]